MGRLFITAFVLVLALKASSSIVEPKTCSSSSSSHTLVLSQLNQDVEFRFDDNQNVEYEPIGRSPAYPLTGKTITFRTLHNIKLRDLVRKPDLIRTLIVGMMRSRQEFDGDADLHSSYAHSFIESMNCK